jgi:hypothetical protein
MRYVLFNWLNPDDAATWEGMSAEQQQEAVQRLAAPARVARGLH